MNFLATFFLLISTNAFAGNYCPSSNALLAASWTQHSPSEFNQVKDRFAREIKNEQFFKKDLETIFASPYLESWVHFISFDDMRTSDLEMLGDVVFYSKPSGETFEIRWYEGGKKHFVISADQCSCDDAPLAENALF